MKTQKMIETVKLLEPRFHVNLKSEQDLKSRMGLSLILEEIEVLEAIFCEENEFVLHTDLGSVSEDQEYVICFSIQINILADQSHDRPPQWLKVTFSLDAAYPEKIKNITLNSVAFTRKKLEILKNEINDYLIELIGSDKEPRIMQIIKWIEDQIGPKEDLDGVSANLSSVSKNAAIEGEKLVVLKLDHMRAKQKYTKIISNWANSFGLSGRLVFFGKLIWIILCGRENAIKEYIKNLRTCNVDVDSSGRPCKERMMNVVLETDKKISAKMSNSFKCMEFESRETMDEELRLFGIDLSDLQP